MDRDRFTLRLTLDVDVADQQRLSGLLVSTTPASPVVQAPQHPDRLLSTSETAEVLGISRSSLYGLRYVGDAPPAIKVGSRLRWRRSDVEAWIDEKLEERPAPRW